MVAQAHLVSSLPLRTAAPEKNIKARVSVEERVEKGILWGTRKVKYLVAHCKNGRIRKEVRITRTFWERLTGRKVNVTIFPSGSNKAKSYQIGTKVLAHFFKENKSLIKEKERSSLSEREIRKQDHTRLGLLFKQVLEGQFVSDDSTRGHRIYDRRVKLLTAQRQAQRNAADESSDSDSDASIEAERNALDAGDTLNPSNELARLNTALRVNHGVYTGNSKNEAHERIEKVARSVKFIWSIDS